MQEVIRQKTFSHCMTGNHERCTNQNRNINYNVYIITLRLIDLLTHLIPTYSK